jgi:hypothetical protein
MTARFVHDNEVMCDGCVRRMEEGRRNAYVADEDVAARGRSG